MQSETPAPSGSKALVWVGRVLSGLAGAMLLLDGVMKLVKPSFVVEESAKIGLAESALVPLGLALSVGVVLYLIPRTSVLGAIVVTGYLGGAVATHVFNKHGAFEITLPIIFGALIWLGLVLRDPKVRAVLPLRT